MGPATFFVYVESVKSCDVLSLYNKTTAYQVNINHAQVKSLFGSIIGSGGATRRISPTSSVDNY